MIAYGNVINNQLYPPEHKRLCQCPSKWCLHYLNYGVKQVDVTINCGRLQ